jgi:dynein heavy chain
MCLSVCSVERWLIQVQAIMFESVRDQCAKSWVEYPAIARQEWVLRWPSQVVLCVSQIFWAVDVCAGITGGQKALTATLDKNNKQLEKIVSLVRKPQSRLDRATLGALVVIDVHARDVVQLLVDRKVTDLTDFDWISQLRIYWEDANAKARMISATLDYGSSSFVSFFKSVYLVMH